MDYGPFLSATLEVGKDNIANKGIAIRLDPGDGGVARGREFFLFETDTLRAAAVWTGPEFIDWKNIAFDGTHEVHASVIGHELFINPDAPGWADAGGSFDAPRVVGRDGKRYGPLPRSWGHWKGLYVAGEHVALSYTVGETDVLESPGAEGEGDNRALSRTFNIGPRSRALVLQVAEGKASTFGSGAGGLESAVPPVVISAPALESSKTLVLVVGAPAGTQWIGAGTDQVRLSLPASQEPVRFKILFCPATANPERQAATVTRTSAPTADLSTLTHGGPARWSQTTTTKLERIFDARQPYQLESITLPLNNPYHAWMRTSAFDFFNDGRRAAICTWQGDVWIVDGLGGALSIFNWKRIASGLFQPLGLKIVNEQIYVTCRDQITVLRDLNGDGETDFYENFNNDAQVTEHFHEFAMDLQTDRDGNFYYAKGGRHAKDALVPQHGTLLRVSKDGQKTDIVAYGFRAPNGVCVNNDGTYIVSDQEGHWTPENRINWVQPGKFYGYMMGYHEGRKEADFEPPVVWIHKSLDRSPAEQLWVDSDQWGLPRGALISLSYGTGKILEVLYERVGDIVQGGVITLPIAPTPTGIIRGRFRPTDGQLYAAGLFGWASDKTRPGGFYRVRYTGKALHLPSALRATHQGMVIRFVCALDKDTALDAENYAVSQFGYHRTANYGSEDYRLSDGQRGRDTVTVSGVKLSKDNRTVLLQIPDQQPCTQMEIKYNLQAEDGTRLSQLIENTILAVGADVDLDGAW
jgi:hypothetical protein